MIKAQISSIRTNECVSVFEFRCQNLKLSMLGLENLSNLKIGDNVNLSFKSSDVVIARYPLKECSLRNEIKAVITDFKKGSIVSVLHLRALDFEFESIISTDSFERLNLKRNDEIYAYIKATSLHISENNDD